jgi:hypothetical protein
MKEKELNKNKTEERDPLVIVIDQIMFPDADSFKAIYNELSKEGKEALDKMRKEGRVKIQS